MLSVTRSTFTTDSPQVDGRVWVTERHEISDGTVQEFKYLADPDLDFGAVMRERAAALDAQFASDASGAA